MEANLKLSTRYQERKNNQQESLENLNECLVSILVAKVNLGETGVMVAGPSNAKSHRVEDSILERLRTSLKEEITSEVKRLILELLKGQMKLLKSKSGGNECEESETTH